MKNPAPKNVQPEALAQFGKSARNDVKNSSRPGQTADSETKAVPTDPKIEHRAATKVLREGVFHRDERAMEEIARLPDRITKDRAL